jgi:hypothetical protein
MRCGNVVCALWVFFFSKFKKSNFLTYSWRTRPMLYWYFFEIKKKAAPPPPERSCHGCPSVGEDLIEEENGEEVAGKEVTGEEVAGEEVAGEEVVGEEVQCI